MKKKKIINFSAIGLSLVFLLNPNINIIDFLPDFIGYILLCVALTSLSDINETVADALGMFKKLILIDAAKIVALLWVFGISVVNERNSSLMLWSFTFGVLEMLFVIPAFIKLFKGITELGYLHDNTSVVGAKKAGSKKNYTDKVRSLTVLFVGLKAVMSFLPELSDLTSTEYNENMGITNMYRYIGLMRMLCFIPVLIVGIIWIVRCVTYFNRVSKDVEFVGALERVYDEKVAHKSGIFVKRNIAIAFGVLLVATFFSLDFRMENINMFPDFVSAVLLFAFFLVISKKTKMNVKLPVALACVYFAVSVWAYVSEVAFFRDFYYGAIYRSEEAMSAYVLMAVSACVSTLLFVLLCFAALRCINAVIDSHTGVISVSMTQGEAQAKMNAAIRKEQKKYIKMCVAATVLYAVTDVFYVFLIKDHGFLFLLNVLGAIAFIVSFAKLYFEVSEAVNSKYILE